MRNPGDETTAIPASRSRWPRLVAGLVLALVLGLIGLSLLFSDLARGESSDFRILSAAAWFLASGFCVSLVAGLGAWAVSGFAAWGGILLAAVNLDRTRTVLIYGVLPLVLSLFGGWIGGRVLRARRRGRG